MALGWNWTKFPGTALDKLIEYLNTSLKALDNMLGRTPVYTPVRDVTDTYTIVDSDELIRADGTFTVTLPPGTDWKGRQATIKNVGTGTITVQGNGSDLIDGAGSKTILRQYEVIQVRWNGASWDQIVQTDRALVVEQDGVSVVSDTTAVNIVGATVTESPTGTAVVTITPLTVEDAQETPVVVSPVTTLHFDGKVTVEDLTNGEAAVHIVEDPLVVQDNGVEVEADTTTINFLDAVVDHPAPHVVSVTVNSRLKQVTYTASCEVLEDYSAHIVGAGIVVVGGTPYDWGTWVESGTTVGTWTNNNDGTITVPSPGRYYVTARAIKDSGTSPDKKYEMILETDPLGFAPNHDWMIGPPNLDGTTSLSRYSLRVEGCFPVGDPDLNFGVALRNLHTVTSNTATWLVTMTIVQLLSTGAESVTYS